MPETIDPEEDDLAGSSFMAFARRILKFDLYEWQEDSVEPFDEASERMVRVTLRTPNGSGKSAVVIPTLVLGWLYFYPQGRVVLTTKDGRQLDGQVMPALEAHRLRFPEWKFIERHIETPTGGRFDAFTTDDAGRAEGWHKLNDDTGPLLVIADEAKSIPEDIFTALDRCTYNALLLASSPGRMAGRFYDSQVRPELGYIRVSVGLVDCPHIGQDKIDRIIAEHGADAPFTRSTLHGEFMVADDEAKFDRIGLEHMAAMAKEGHAKGALGIIERSHATGSAVFIREDATPWLWMDGPPQFGRSYLMTCDPNTCEQGEGTEERDNTACAIIRQGWLDTDGAEHKDAVVACLHWPGGVKWDSDVLARRMATLARFYGDCMTVVEANNFGSALMKDLQREGVRLWRRTKIDDVNPNKEVRINGFLSTGRSREHWVQACAKAVRDQSLICRYKPACDEFSTFVILANGRAEAQQGCHDDWVAAIGIGLTVQCWTRLSGAQPSRPESRHTFSPMLTSHSMSERQPCPFGACG